MASKPIRVASARYAARCTPTYLAIVRPEHRVSRRVVRVIAALWFRLQCLRHGIVRPMKRLILLRHGKSDWNAGASSDHGRPLSRRGTGAAMTMGRVLAQLGESPDLILTSSAVRARETALLAADAGGWECETVEVDDLYGASAGEALAVAATAPDDVERLMLVGHEPGWGYLVRALTGAEVSMKTATIAGIDMARARWAYAPRAAGTLTYLLQPRLFARWEF